ncbi:MAG: adenosine deaminase [Paracoccaceae bacterium]|jgi:adenosine deaminase
MTVSDDFIRRLPKAELHLHIEGSFEPELMFEIARRNEVDLPYATVNDLKAAYDFADLQAFLDLYYAGMSVLLKEQDFYDLTAAYMKRAVADGVVHTEIFFDPQGHTERGVPFEVALDSIWRALRDAEAENGITSRIIMCFLRHLDEDEAFPVLEQAMAHRDRIVGVGLDSSELGHPPQKFERVFARARDAGFRLVAHAGEEGPPEYVRDTLDLLHVDRVDHGNAAMADPDLVTRLASEKMPLTVCPLSNYRLQGVTDMSQHPLRAMLDAGLVATINSDDPAYFGGYVLENYIAVRDALDLSQDDIVTLARNSIIASFLDDAAKKTWLTAIESASR